MELTRDDLRALKTATSVVFIREADGSTTATARADEVNAGAFAARDVERPIPVGVGRVLTGSGTAGRCTWGLRMSFNDLWQTMVAHLKPGDELRPVWTSRYHAAAQIRTELGVNLETFGVNVYRNGKRVGQYLLDTQMTAPGIGVANVTLTDAVEYRLVTP